MVLMIQIIGIVVGLIFVYLTHLYFRRKEFNVIDLGVWGLIWLGFLLGIIFPKFVNDIIDNLNIIRALDFFMIVGFLVLFGIIFYLYIIVKKNNKKMEEFVRKETLEKVKK